MGRILHQLASTNAPALSRCCCKAVVFAGALNMILELIGIFAVAYVITGISFELVMRSNAIPLQGEENLTLAESIFFGALFGVPVMIMTAYSIIFSDLD